MTIGRLILASFLFLCLIATTNAIGVNYGTLGDNLPPPATVANFLKTKTTIDSVKLFDVNPDYIRAFANTGITVAVTAPNGDIVSLTDVNFARQWVVNKIKPFHPATKIRYILVGSEVLHWGDQSMLQNLVPAMKSLHDALQAEGITDIMVTTAHSLIIMETVTPPSTARFRPAYSDSILKPMLQFLRQTKTPFMVNPYPYFNLDPNNVNFAIFKPNPSVFDPFTRRHYKNQFDALLDAVHSAMMAVGFADVDMAVGETGWPSNCDNPAICSVDNAASYNSQLAKHIAAKRGTPLMPNRQFETYIFALFNENQKPGPTAEKNWGLFQPDLTPVYDSGIMGNGQVPAAPIRKKGGHHQGGGGGHHKGKGGSWCVPKPNAASESLQANIDYACSHGIDCGPIQPGGACFEPNTVQAHATYAMNAYYKAKGPAQVNCDFSNSGQISNVNPSKFACSLICAYVIFDCSLEISG
ncbi:glucan endo-1,3-beta-glucosidase-like [Neltuma alba]|uniref:glucan endo-1,3-beta-glucosidase-like n=1 Tax=Neltuma alba TaxID=207710 RepID=UPI0010A42E72|nr:glucan endo-1,3-beta-glucosidase-like [Prosopis alba]